MPAFLLRRVLLAVPVIAAVSTLVFLLIHLIPGDPTDFMAGENATLEKRDTVRRAHRLHLPILFNTWALNSLETVRAQLVAAIEAGPRGEVARLELHDRAATWAPMLYQLARHEPDPAVRATALAALLDGLHQVPHPLPAGAVDAPEMLEARATVERINRRIAEENDALAALRVTPSPEGLRRLAQDRGIVTFGPGARVREALSSTQYAFFFRNLLAGRTESLHSRRSVGSILRQKFPMTLRLGLSALTFAAAIALPLGTLAAARQYSAVDQSSMLAALVGVSMPNFWLGPLLILLFSVELNWFPVSGAEGVRSLVLPALTLGLGMAALLTRMVRASMLEVLQADYIRTARAKGVPERRVLFRHALRSALIPVVTVLGLQFGAVLSGSIITEEIFGWPGLGRELVNAIRTRDFPLIQGCVLLISVSYVTVNVLTDLVYGWIDPRVRLE